MSLLAIISMLLLFKHNASIELAWSWIHELLNIGLIKSYSWSWLNKTFHLFNSEHCKWGNIFLQNKSVSNLISKLLFSSQNNDTTFRKCIMNSNFVNIWCIWYQFRTTCPRSIIFKRIEYSHIIISYKYH